MSYPATIANDFGFDMSNTGMGQFEFVYGSARYCCLQDPGNHASGFHQKLHMFKSTNQGQSWTELDSANAWDVQGSQTGVPFPYTLAVDGDTVHLLVTRMHVSAGVTILDGLTRNTFDLVDGEWGSPTDISSGGMDFVTGRKIVFQIIVRAAGDYIVIHSGTRASGFARTSYSPYDGSSLGTKVDVPSQSASVRYMPVGGAYDPVSGVVLIEYREGGQTGTNGKIWTVGLDDSNTLGTPVQVVSSAVWDWEFQSPPILYDNGGTPTFAFVTTRLTGGNAVIDFQQAPAELDPTYDSPVNIFTGNAATNQQVPTLTNLFAGGDAKSMAFGAGSTLLQACWTAWLFDEDNQQWVYIASQSVIGSGTWSSAATLFQPSTADNSHKTCQVYSSSGPDGIGTIGVSFENSGDRIEEPQFYLSDGAAVAALHNTFE